jgi:acrylyl-CoA reductase (NADPH)
VPALPSSVSAFVAEKTGDEVVREVRTLGPDDLGPGEVTVRVSWSGVNYKDGLASTAGGKVARISPLIPGVDLAGEVVDGPGTGTEVIVHGYDLGVAHHGGFAQYARVPADWVVPLPAGLSAREAMTLGTAGFTAALSVVALQERGLAPGDGPVLVTGATGGVGSTAVSMLAGLGHEVVASSGKTAETGWLRDLGAADVIDRAETSAEGRPLDTQRWAGVVDCVGGPTLAYALRTLRTGGAVAASGNTGGVALATTVLPFILRGVALLGIDSVTVPLLQRTRVWERIAADLRPAGLAAIAAREVGLDELEPALEDVLAGRARGRTLVRPGP